MRRLLPEPAVELTVEEAYPGPLDRRDDRPWVGVCMVASIDGSIAFDGTSGGLSSDTDAAVLARMRWLADVTIVGAGTVQAEGYGPPKKPGQRIGVVTGSGNVDVGTELFTSGSAFVITGERGRRSLPSGVDVLCAGDDRVDLAAAIGMLGEVVERPDFVLAEGGGGLNGALVEADLLDELAVTTCPAAVGGSGPRLASGTDEAVGRYTAAQIALDDDGFVYTRWLRRR
jgi:riboflavin biosynthesis pyrimidine reductase